MCVGQKLVSGVLICHSPVHFLKLKMSLPIFPTRLAGWPVSSWGLPLPHGLQRCANIPDFCMDAGNLNSGSHACVPSPQPFILLRVNFSKQCH